MKKRFAVKQKRPRSIAVQATLLRSAASALEHGRRATAQKKLAQIASDQFTPRQTDTMIAALRLFQNPGPVDALLWAQELASEHGEPLNNKEIDALVDQINTPVGTIPESVKEARAGLIPSDETDALRLCDPLRRSDTEIAMLDAAVNTVEDILRPLLQFYNANQVASAFRQHAMIHLEEELSNIEAHGHRDDNADEEPKPTAYSDLLRLAELIEAGNTEFDALERNATEVLKRVRRLR